PDLIIMFETDMKTLQERTQNEEKILDGIELRGLEYLINVQEKMRESLNRLEIPYLLIDARMDIETIHQKIYDKIEKAIK
ncbi:MAG TPA: dTMP kinase, partial [Sulfurovum sp.]|nr:dTMP kinase [Sulfurovum sp.]